MKEYEKVWNLYKKKHHELHNQKRCFVSSSIWKNDSKLYWRLNAWSDQNSKTVKATMFCQNNVRQLERTCWTFKGQKRSSWTRSTWVIVLSFYHCTNIQWKNRTTSRTIRLHTATRNLSRFFVMRDLLDCECIEYWSRSCTNKKTEWSQKNSWNSIFACIEQVMNRCSTHDEHLLNACWTSSKQMMFLCSQTTEKSSANVWSRTRNFAKKWLKKDHLLELCLDRKELQKLKVEHMFNTCWTHDEHKVNKERKGKERKRKKKKYILHLTVKTTWPSSTIKKKFNLKFLQRKKDDEQKNKRLPFILESSSCNNIAIRSASHTSQKKNAFSWITFCTQNLSAIIVKK